MRWTKILIALLVIAALEVVCHLFLHTIHGFLLPIELAVAAWAGISCHKCKCSNCDEPK